jgi:3,4-dihydroxy 2-butanone 4-phosphate synthase/GTP cyclohydrolase II
LTGDVFGSQRCDCGQQLDESIEMIAAKPPGVLIYLRQEGRGIGLIEKLKAYNLQDNEELDTVEANLALGHPEDARDFGLAGEILAELGARSIRLITNNPVKLNALAASNISVEERIALRPRVTPFNSNYLGAKHKRFRHLIDL